MDQRFKTIIIAGSIIAVLIGLIVVGTLAYRARLRATPTVETPGPDAGTPPPNGAQVPPSGTKPPLSSGTATGTATTAPTQNGVTTTGSLTPDYSGGPDRDKDGLSDDAEAIYGTNPDKSDTDGDGWSDKDEKTVYGSDPLLKDSTPQTTQGAKFKL